MQEARFHCIRDFLMIVLSMFALWDARWLDQVHPCNEWPTDWTKYAYGRLTNWTGNVHIMHLLIVLSALS